MRDDEIFHLRKRGQPAFAAQDTAIRGTTPTGARNNPGCAGLAYPALGSEGHSSHVKRRDLAAIYKGNRDAVAHAAGVVVFPVRMAQTR